MLSKVRFKTEARAREVALLILEVQKQYVEECSSDTFRWTCEIESPEGERYIDLKSVAECRIQEYKEESVEVDGKPTLDR